MQEEPKMVRVSIKWGTQKFDQLPLDLSSPLAKFKQLLYELTSVPVDKQKIILKGQTLKDDTNLLNLKVPEGTVIMLMGQAEGNTIKLPAEKTIFIEDLTPDERARILKEKAGIILPIGLVNLGNTCYLNSSLQCLKRVNELKKFLIDGQINNQQVLAPNTKKLFQAIRSLLKSLEMKGEAFKPMEFLYTFMSVFPMFAEKEQGGVFKQQDADECFQNILQVIEPMCQYENLQGEQRNLIRDLFEIKMEVTLQNLDIPEDNSVSTESHKKFLCIIDNEFNPINTLIEGVKISLQGQVEKKSSIDNLTHVYSKISKIDRLPGYLIVQMVRFIWKQGQEGKEGVKAKILRQVSFPRILDLFDFCTDRLKQNLQAGKEFEKKQILEHQKQDQDKFELFKKNMEAQGTAVADDTRGLFKKFKEQQKEEEIKSHDEQLYREHGLGLENGCYELIGVLTHKGRFADSGHYVAWIHHSGDQWICYDDDKVSEVTTEQILDLRGGGDWHMGYYLLYRKLEIQ